MKKFLLALVVLSGAAFNSFAQSDSEGGFSIGVEAGIPVGTTKTLNSFVIGGSLKYDMPVSDGLLFGISAGVSSIQGKTVSGTKYPSTTAVPVKVGLKYFFSEGFYGEAQAGAAFLTKGGGTAFAYAPGIGYSFGGGFDIGVRYEGWSKSGGTISQIATRIAYGF